MDPCHGLGRGDGTWTGIGIKHSYALFASRVLKKTLLGAIVSGAGQSGEVYEEGHSVQRVRGGLGWKVEVESHFAIGGRGIVGEL